MDYIGSALLHTMVTGGKKMKQNMYILMSCGERMECTVSLYKGREFSQKKKTLTWELETLDFYQGIWHQLASRTPGNLSMK